MCVFAGACMGVGVFVCACVRACVRAYVCAFVCVYVFGGTVRGVHCCSQRAASLRALD